jgi:hypothetical protein
MTEIFGIQASHFRATFDSRYISVKLLRIKYFSDKHHSICVVGSQIDPQLLITIALSVVE